ncbi:MAG: PA2779 family protein [Gammaproteobacteria bacterium]
MDSLRKVVRPLIPVITVCLLWLGVYGSVAQAAMIGTETVVNAQQAQQERQRLRSLYQRAEVVSALRANGINPKEALARVDALTDQEVHRIVGHVDQLPAGSGVLEVLLVIFLVLVITDLLGLTDVFTFVHRAR